MAHKLGRILLLLPFVLALSVAAQTLPGSTYIRLVPDAQGNPDALETSITRLTSPTGQKVDLVAAVHLGEESYYRALNELFRDYDAVLYEAVLQEPSAGPAVQPSSGGGPARAELPDNGAPGAAGPPQPEPAVQIDTENPGTHPVTLAQRWLSRLLGLRYQLGEIDYSAPNFVHADLTSTELGAAMQDRGETPIGLLLQLLTTSVEADPDADRELSGVSLFRVVTGSVTPEERVLLRRAFARSFPKMDSVLAELQGSALLEARNQRAVQVLRRQLEGGKSRIAVFFGTAHMPDLESRLVTELGLTRQGQSWLTAWDL
ncbi:MAG: hypothetical protein HY319_01280 [Armatimonadetes bacterium]|nr:hypothetical protein [Armatimonadota bacterium]